MNKRDVAISMRLRESDLGMIDRGAEISGLSRTEFVRRAALHDAQLAVLNETVTQMGPEAWTQFCEVIDGVSSPITGKMKARLSRLPPWQTE